MRRILTSIAAAALLCAPLLAAAAEEAKAADTGSSTATADSSSSSSTDSSASSSSSSSSDMSGGTKDAGGLFDTAAYNNKHGISAFVLTPYDYWFGIGMAVRYTLPIVPGGFISKLNDSLELEMGADFSYSWSGFGNFSYVNLVVPAVEARWSFHFTRRWEAYGKAGLGFQWRGYNTSFAPRRGALDWVYINVGVGGLMHLNDVLAIRAEVGYGGLRVGMGFSF